MKNTVLPLLLVLVLLCGCAVKSEPVSVKADLDVPVFMSVDPNIVHENPLVETINGYKISDPFRWLEDPAKAESFVEYENRRTEAYFDSVQVEGIAERIDSLFRIGYVAKHKTAAGKLFYLKFDGGQEQPVLIESVNGKEKVVLNLNDLDPSGKTALDWYFPSETGKLLAYGLSKNGDENSTLHLLDLDTMQKRDDVIANTRHCSLAWLSDDSGFYYTRYPEGDHYHRHIYFHKIGTDSANDEYVWGKQRKPADWTNVQLTEDDRYLILYAETGTTTNDAYIVDRKTGKTTTALEGRQGQLFFNKLHKGRLIGSTSLDAPNWKIVSVDPKNPAPENWRVVLPEQPMPLNEFEIVSDRLITVYKETAVDRIMVYDFAGEKIGDVALPMMGMVSNVLAMPHSGDAYFTYSSPVIPPSLYRLSPKKSLDVVPVVLTSTGDRFNPDDFAVSRVEYPSYDGTMVPMFLVHKKGLKLDGTNPTLLYGYGGFAISMGPYFSRSNLFWVERGGVFALAAIRGGSEKGESWHKAGMLDKKFQVFEDFEYAMRYLIRQNYTRPEHLAIRGGSNGGLLVGAMITRAPYLFSAALGHVGLYDMVRYQKFPPAQLWVPEYGSADNPDQTGFILGYSPYHQVLPGVRYPACFIQTAESDTRVNWLHSAKFSAALQRANIGNKPILFYLQRKAGHGQGMNWSEMVNETVQTYKFIIDQIGDPAKPAH